jgi:hypothetical protein
MFVVPHKEIYMDPILVLVVVAVVGVGAYFFLRNRKDDEVVVVEPPPVEPPPVEPPPVEPPPVEPPPVEPPPVEPPPVEPPPVEPPPVEPPPVVVPWEPARSYPSKQALIDDLVANNFNFVTYVGEERVNEGFGPALHYDLQPDGSVVVPMLLGGTKKAASKVKVVPKKAPAKAKAKKGKK